jgi:2-oxo-3-hexenedioate decarboxylase
MSTLDLTQTRALAEHLETCQAQARETTKITDQYPGMDWEDAYAVQDAILARKLVRGARLAGLKAGLTSRAKMQQMGISVPVFGFLTDDYAVPEGGDCDIGRLIHPKVEPEIAFVTKRTLKGPGCTIAAVLAATDFVLPGLEVIDSRYRDFRFDLKSVVADNTSAARFVVGGRPLSVDDIDLRTVGIVLEKNGAPVGFGAAAAVLGHPATAVAALVNHEATRGRDVPARTLILSGGITEAIPVEAGDFVAVRVQGMGSVGMRFTRQ